MEQMEQMEQIEQIEQGPELLGLVSKVGIMHFAKLSVHSLFQQL